MISKSSILGRNVLSNFGAHALIFLVSFFSTPIILRGMGQRDYGLLIFLGTVVNFLLALDFGLIPAFIQLFSQKIAGKKQYESLYFSAFIFYLILNLIPT